MSKDQKEAIDHLKKHIQYPATAAEIKKACNEMSDVADDLKNVINRLPDGNYNSADEVITLVGW